MREYTETPTRPSRTLETTAGASTQAPISEILQAYRDGTLGRGAVPYQNTEDGHLLQTGNSGDNSKLENGIDQTSYEVVMQRKGAGINTVIQLEKMKITIKDNKNTAEGQSGREFDTKSKLRQWPAIYEKFEALGEIEATGEEGKYMRNAFMCAEPNAFASLLNLYSPLLNHPISKAWFAQVNFPQKAIGVETRHPKDPCPMCSKWVGNTLPLKIKDTVKPTDPITNNLQIATDKEEAGAQYAFESVLGYFMDEDYEGDRVFDNTLSIGTGIEGCYEELDKYSLGTIPTKHAEIWGKIVHKNNSVDFVEKATGIYDSILKEKSIIVSTDTSLRRFKEKAKETVKEEMKKYEKLCSEAQTLDVIIQLVKELYVDDNQNVTGNINNIDRHVALLPVPVMKGVSLEFTGVDIEEDGNIRLHAFVGTEYHSWESSVEDGEARLDRND